MKIGIITQPLHSNYGGLLQNYALQQVLKRMGHEVVTLDQSNVKSKRWRTYAACVKTFLLRSIGKGKSRTYPFYISDSIRKQIRVHTDRFINKYIFRSPVLNEKEDFKTFTEIAGIDTLIVGSDQVWRPRYNKDVLRSFLDFTEGMSVNRIAYAASFGVDSWEFTQEHTMQAKELIKTFDAVSVREDSGIGLCKEYLGCDAVHVLDPTMLLDKEDYIKLVEEEHEPVSKGDLFTYILDASPEKQSVIEEVATMLKLTPFTSMPQNKINRETVKQIETCIFPPVTQWLRSFMDAKFVICDSFHGAVFSIIFNKSFLVIGNKDRGMSRFDSLLKMFGLEDRMKGVDSSVFSIVNVSINWEDVNRRRELMKEKSIDLITKALN